MAKPFLGAAKIFSAQHFLEKIFGECFLAIFPPASKNGRTGIEKTGEAETGPPKDEPGRQKTHGKPGRRAKIRNPGAKTRKRGATQNEPDGRRQARNRTRHAQNDTRTHTHGNEDHRNHEHAQTETRKTAPNTVPTKRTETRPGTRTHATTTKPTVGARHVSTLFRKTLPRDTFFRRAKRAAKKRFRETRFPAAHRYAGRARG